MLEAVSFVVQRMFVEVEAVLDADIPEITGATVSAGGGGVAGGVVVADGGSFLEIPGGSVR